MAGGEAVLGSRPRPGTTTQPSELNRIDAIGGYSAALAKLGIRSPERLLDELRAPAGAAQLARELDVDPTFVSDWHDLLELLAIPGIGPAQLNLLEAADVTRREQLTREPPQALHRRLVQVNIARQLVHAVPSLETLGDWQRDAASR